MGRRRRYYSSYYPRYRRRQSYKPSSSPQPSQPSGSLGLSGCVAVGFVGIVMPMIGLFALLLLVSGWGTAQSAPQRLIAWGMLAVFFVAFLKLAVATVKSLGRRQPLSAQNGHQTMGAPSPVSTAGQQQYPQPVPQQFDHYWHQGHFERALTLDQILALSPTAFEYFVADLLKASGYQNVRRTGGGGDLGADVTCFTTDGRYVVVQCKRYARHNYIGSPALQQFIGMITVHHRAHGGIFVTTSVYSQAARALAQQHGISLVDGDELMRWTQRVRDQQRAPVMPPHAPR